jgi:hypothetical protein
VHKEVVEEKVGGRKIQIQLVAVPVRKVILSDEFREQSTIVNVSKVTKNPRLAYPKQSIT